jgi:hypothetical protein
VHQIVRYAWLTHVALHKQCVCHCHWQICAYRVIINKNNLSSVNMRCFFLYIIICIWWKSICTQYIIFQTTDSICIIAAIFTFSNKKKWQNKRKQNMLIPRFSC